MHNYKLCKSAARKRCCCCTQFNQLTRNKRKDIFMFNEEEVVKKVVNGFVIESKPLPILARSTQRKHARELRKRLEAEIGLDADTAVQFAHYLQTLKDSIEFCEYNSFGSGSSKKFSVGNMQIVIRYVENAYWSVEQICYTHIAKFLHKAITNFVQQHSNKAA